MAKIKRIAAVFVSVVMLMSLLALTPVVAAESWKVKQNTSVPKAISGGLVISQANPSVGKVSDYEYKFVYQRDNWKVWGVISHFGSKNRVSFKPGKAGVYEIFADVRNKKTGKIVTTSSKFTIKPAWNLASVTATKTSIKPGETVIITPNITGDKTGVTYKYVWERNNWNTWGVISKGMTKAQGWKPSVPGNYNVHVDATDKYGNVISKKININVSKVAATQGQLNALKAAKRYLSVMPFSKKGLINQLLYGKYTLNEATYAVDNCGANWKEQAAKKAKKYLEIMSFSKERLIAQLKYDGFTDAEAIYGVEQNGY